MSLPEGTYNTRYAQDMAVVRTRLQWSLFIALLILLFALPFLTGNTHILSLANTIGITIVAVLGLNILTGYAGQISLGQAAFVAVGAYTTAAFSAKLGLPFWVALPASGIVAGSVGLVFALPAARIKGFYLAMSTLAAHFIILYAIVVFRNVTGGVDGLGVPPARLGGIVFDNPKSFYFITISTVVLMTFLAKNISRTPLGRAFIAVRDNDLAAEVMGINVFGYKLLAFFFCCFFAGIAGSLWAYNFQFVHPEQYPLTDAIWYLGIVIVGGMGSITGAILGTVLIKLLGELTTIVLVPFVSRTIPAFSDQAAASLAPIIFGSVIILFLIFEPRGLAHRWAIFKNSYRLWPFAHSVGRR